MDLRTHPKGCGLKSIQLFDYTDPSKDTFLLDSIQEVYYHISEVIQLGVIYMQWSPDKNRPICPQICEQICLEIAEKIYKPQERLPSVREVASALGVNPNTVQRAFEQLDRQQIIYSIRGSGWYVREDISVARKVLHQIRCEKTASFFAEMQALGLAPEETKTFVEEWYHE